MSSSFLLPLLTSLDSTSAFPFIFIDDSPIHHLLQLVFSSLPFMLDFATIPFVLTTEHTESIH